MTSQCLYLILSDHGLFFPHCLKSPQI